MDDWLRTDRLITEGRQTDRLQTNRQASRGRQTDDIMKRYGKAEGRQTTSRQEQKYCRTDWQVGGKRQTYRRQVVDRHPYGNRQTSDKRQLYKIKFENLRII